MTVSLNSVRIFDPTFWNTQIGPLEGVTFGDAEPSSVEETLHAMNHVPNLTVIAMPQGFTIRKLESLIKAFQAEDKFPGFVRFSPRFLKEIGDIPVEKTYTCVISDEVLPLSTSQSWEEHQDLVTKLGYEMPKLIEMMTSVFFRCITGQEDFYDGTRTHCAERIGGSPLSVRTHPWVGGLIIDTFRSPSYAIGVAVTKTIPYP